MSDFGFDARGNLKPYRIVELSEKEFYNFFVEDFPPTSSRHQLFENYRNYLKTLSPLIENGFSLWIDGSFVSNKENPNDIDIVLIIDHLDYDLNKSIFETKFEPSNVRKEMGVDGYVIRRYPKDHPKHFFTESDSLYWKSLFGKTKVNRAKKQFPKGIVQLNFN